MTMYDYGVDINMMDFYYNTAARTHIAVHNAKRKIAEKLVDKASKYALASGFLAFTAPAFAEGTGVSGILSSGETLIADIVDFIMKLAVLMGVGGILYGLKLIMDKSNDRENVKNSHIAFSLVGGAFLVVLWFVVKALAESAGSTEIGGEASF